MNNLPRQKLCELVAAHGRGLCDDPRRCEALLRDVCGEYRRLGLASLGIGIALALNGNRLAWQNRRFQSIEDFKNCERIWRNWAIGYIVAMVALGIIGALLDSGSR